jgi:hypothetical protein
LALLLLALSALWCVLWFLHALPYWEDDAYIHLEFARSLASGQGFSFNGHVVYGDTSPIWVYLLAAFHSVIPDWIAAGKVLAVCGVLFACAGAFVFARKLTGDTLFGAAMVLLFVANPYFNYWAFSGMETIAAAGLALFGAAIVSDRIIAWPRFFAGCLIVGLGPITRPEMVFLSAILAILLIFRWTQLPGTLTAKLPGFFAGLILAAGPAVAWSLYALHAFGRLVPNTNAAKRAGPHESVALRLVNVYALGYPAIFLAALAGVLYIALYIARNRQQPSARPVRSLPAGGWVFIVWTAITTVFYIVNHTYVQTRYAFVSASGLLITVLAIVYLRFPRIVRASVAATLLAALAVSVEATWPFVTNKSQADQATTRFALWIKQNLPPDAPVAIYSIGQVAFISQHPIVDTGGITRPSVIPFLDNPVALERWVRGQGALYNTTGDQPEPGAVLVYSAEEPTKGWYLNPRRYRDRERINLWKLPPNPAP